MKGEVSSLKCWFFRQDVRLYHKCMFICLHKYARRNLSQYRSLEICRINISELHNDRLFFRIFRLTMWRIWSGQAFPHSITAAVNKSTEETNFPTAGKISFPVPILEEVIKLFKESISPFLIKYKKGGRKSNYFRWSLLIAFLIEWLPKSTKAAEVSFKVSFQFRQDMMRSPLNLIAERANLEKQLTYISSGVSERKNLGIFF